MTYSQWELSVFDPHRIDHHKFVAGDYVHDCYCCEKFGGVPSMGVTGQIGEI